MLLLSEFRFGYDFLFIHCVTIFISLFLYHYFGVECHADLHEMLQVRFQYFLLSLKVKGWIPQEVILS